jgi:acyl carrier protein
MAKTIDFDKVKADVKAIVSQVAEIDADKIKEDALFAEDLGVDSMMALEIAASIEKKLKVVIPEDQIPNIRSLKHIYDLLEKLMEKK